jgi:hypothetical protein
MKRERLTVLIPLFACLAGAAHAAQGDACIPTQGFSQILHPSFPPSDRWYGTEKLAVILRPGGVWRGKGPKYNYRDKLFWWTAGFTPGSESNLKVTSVRLDEKSPPVVISRVTNAFAESLGGWTMLVMLELPSAGCWQITGEYLGTKLSFVVDAQSDEPLQDRG